MIQEDLFDTQRQMENRASWKGFFRYYANKDRQAQQGEAGYHKPHLNVIRGAIPATAKEVQSWVQAHQGEGKQYAGRTHTALPFVSALDSDHVAFTGLFFAFNAVTAGHDLRKMNIEVGKQIHEEVWASQLRNENPDLFERIFSESVQAGGQMWQRLRAMRRKTQNREDVPEDPCTEEELTTRQAEESHETQWSEEELEAVSTLDRL